MEINAVGLIKRINKTYSSTPHTNIIVSKTLHTFLLLMEVTCTLQQSLFNSKLFYLAYDKFPKFNNANMRFSKTVSMIVYLTEFQNSELANI